MAAKPAAPADDDDDTGGDAGGSADADAGSEGDDAEQQPSVVATILCYPDGSYGLTQGDENEEDAGGESQGAPAGGEDTGAGGGAAGDGAEPQRFGTIGELLHGVMSAVKSYEATKGGGTEAEGMAAGYAGASGGGAAGGM